MGILRWERNEEYGFSVAHIGEIEVAKVIKTEEPEFPYHWRSRLTISGPEIPFGGYVATEAEGFADAEAYWKELLRRAGLAPIPNVVPPAPALKRYKYDENTWFVEFDSLLIGRVERNDSPYEDEKDDVWHWIVKDIANCRVKVPQSGSETDIEDAFKGIENYWEGWLDQVGLMANPAQN